VYNYAITLSNGGLLRKESYLPGFFTEDASIPFTLLTKKEEK
jgi:hypothetical protein